MWRVAIILLMGSVLGAACRGADELGIVRSHLLVIPFDAGQGYASVDSSTGGIDLGEVPVFGSKYAIWELRNTTSRAIQIDGIELRAASGRWLLEGIALEPNLPATARQAYELGANRRAYLHVLYAPRESSSADLVDIVIDSDADNAIEDEIRVQARGAGGPALPGPDLEIAYGTYVGPSPADCATRFNGDAPVIEVDETGKPIIDICRVPQEHALDFGNINPGRSGTIDVHLRNLADCPAMPGLSTCDTCAITIAPDPTRQGLGLAFRPDNDPDAVFALASPPALPVVIGERDPMCDATGELVVRVKFAAPVSGGEYASVLVIEADDPDEPLIEIPVRGAARNAPIAVAKLRAPDPNDPDAPYVDAGAIEQLARVHLDGSASYDPAAPDDPSRISGHTWDIVDAPPGANPDDFVPNGQGTAYYSFKLPLAGRYRARLTVTNVDGMSSGASASAFVELTARPQDQLHVQLVWDEPTNDQDLHLTYASVSDRVCGDLYDCHFRAPSPLWFGDAGPGTGPNPLLAIDDTRGLGPENINIDTPRAGRYGIYVHYYSDYTGGDVTPTRETVRIFVDGELRAEYRRTLSAYKALWHVAEIEWGHDGFVAIAPAPADVPGEVGAVAVMLSCDPEGFEFP